MVYRGHIENGNIVIDEPASLPEGVAVEIHIVSAAQIAPPVEVDFPRERPWLKLSGTVHDLPPDASLRVDELLYGRPEE
jgi:hypothetical protein